MWDTRVGKGPAHNSGPAEFVGKNCVRGADIRVWLKSKPKIGEETPSCSDGLWGKMLFTKTIVTGVAFDALIRIYCCFSCFRVDVYCSHRANIRAVPAGDALRLIDLHLLPPSIPCALNCIQNGIDACIPNSIRLSTATPEKLRFLLRRAHVEGGSLGGESEADR